MKRPRVIFSTLASVDGRITLAPDVILLFGDERWQGIAGTGDPYERPRNVYKPQAILEGSGSFVASNTKLDPLPPVTGAKKSLYQDFLPDAVVNRPEHRGWFTAVDSGGRVRWLYKEWPEESWKGWHLLVLAANSTPPEYLAYLQRENIPYLIEGDKRVDLKSALEKMRSKLKVECLLSTGGGKLNGAMLRAGLIDEINIEFMPALIGGGKTPKLFDGPELKANEWPTRLKLISSEALDNGRVWLRYEVVREQTT